MLESNEIRFTAFLDKRSDGGGQDKEAADCRRRPCGPRPGAPQRGLITVSLEK